MVTQTRFSITLLIVGLVLPIDLGLQAQVQGTTGAGPRVDTFPTSVKPSAKDENEASYGLRETRTQSSNVELLPPQAPQITYQNGMLSIRASNSTLEQVFHALQAETGMSVDYPAGAAGEKITVQLGPGKPTDVLIQLLNGSNFGYIILGVPGGSTRVEKLILTVRQGTEPGMVPSAPNAGPLAVVEAKAPIPNGVANGAHPVTSGSGEPSMMQALAQTDLPVEGSNPQQKAQNDPQVRGASRWLQIAQEHAQRMADPANKNLPPPPPPPMEPPPPTQ